MKTMLHENLLCIPMWRREEESHASLTPSPLPKNNRGGEDEEERNGMLMYSSLSNTAASFPTSNGAHYKNHRFWKLQVCHRETGEIMERYLIHPEVVAFGPKGSGYLASLITDDQEEEEEDHNKKSAPTFVTAFSPKLSPPSAPSSPQTAAGLSTVIELKEKHARVVPHLLDFMYLSKPTTTTTNDTDGDTISETTTTSKSVPTTKDLEEEAFLATLDDTEEDDTMSEETTALFQNLYELAVHWQVTTFRIAVAKYQRKHHFTTQTIRKTIGFATQFTEPTRLGSLSFLSRSTSSTTASSSSMHPDNDESTTSSDELATNHSTTSSLLILQSPDPLLEAALNWSAVHIWEYTPARAGEAFEPVHLLQILRQNRKSGIEVHLDDFTRSTIVAHCVHYHSLHQDPSSSSRRRLTQELLHQLTEEEFLPFLSPSFDAPVFLMASSQVVLSREEKDKEKHHKHQQSTTATTSVAAAAGDGSNGGGEIALLSSLEQRCIASITTFWNSCCAGVVKTWGTSQNKVDSRQAVMETAMLAFFQDLRAEVLIQLLENTINVKLKESSILLLRQQSISRLSKMLWDAIQPKLKKNYILDNKEIKKSCAAMNNDVTNETILTDDEDEDDDYDDREGYGTHDDDDDEWYIIEDGFLPIFSWQNRKFEDSPTVHSSSTIDSNGGSGGEGKAQEQASLLVGAVSKEGEPHSSPPASSLASMYTSDPIEKGLGGSDVDGGGDGDNAIPSHATFVSTRIEI